MTPIETLRAMVRLFGHCNETFNAQFTVNDLGLIYQAHTASEYDYLPDQWTDDMINAALEGEPVDQLIPERMR